MHDSGPPPYVISSEAATNIEAQQVRFLIVVKPVYLLKLLRTTEQLNDKREEEPGSRMTLKSMA